MYCMNAHTHMHTEKGFECLVGLSFAAFTSDSDAFCHMHKTCCHGTSERLRFPWCDVLLKYNIGSPGSVPVRILGHLFLLCLPIPAVLRQKPHGSSGELAVAFLKLKDNNLFFIKIKYILNKDYGERATVVSCCWSA